MLNLEKTTHDFINTCIVLGLNDIHISLAGYRCIVVMLYGTESDISLKGTGKETPK